ncbi:MAG: GMC family oxidoreductase [Bradymonadaceae bacterium]
MTEFCDDGLKIETLGYGPAFAATKTDAVGTRLAEDITDLEHWANWAVEIAADAHGSVRSAGPADTRIEYELTDDDMRKIRRGVAIMSELFLAAGADFIAPGVHGWTDRIESPEDLEGFEEEGPLERAHYDFIVSHMFGTCRMGSDPEDNVVRPDFRHHEVDQLYVADSSVFPTNLGVNPQISIMTMAARCADRILQGTGNEE